MEETPVEMILAAKKGNQKAWEDLLARIYPRASRHAFSLLRDKDLAQDAVQNAMIKVYCNLSRLDDEKAFFSWFHRILTNEAFLLLRLNTREAGSSALEAVGQNGIAVEDRVVLRMELSRAVKALPMEQQQMLLEVDFKGMDLKEVAADYGIPLGTVKSRLFRGREKVQQALGHKIRKEKKSMAEGQADYGSKIFDYLEGTMNDDERTEFEQALGKDSDLKETMKDYKHFLDVLHSLTGKTPLSTQQVKDRVNAVIDKTNDYEQVVEDTYFGKTMTSHIWFKKPYCSRVESTHPDTGDMVVVVKDSYVLSWIPKMKKASRVKLGERSWDHNVFDNLKRMAENKTSTVLGTEYVNGRPTVHIQFSQQIPELGEMNTHLWIDKDTWLPIVTEYYNVKGDMVSRREVRELRVNQGIPDEKFELELPEGIEIEETESKINLPEDVSLERAAEMLGQLPFVLPDTDYNVEHQWVRITEDGGVLMSKYTNLGEPFPSLVLTQGPLPHANIPPDVAKEEVEFYFAGDNVRGELFYFDVGMVSSILTWEHGGMLYSAGGKLSKEELLGDVENLVQTDH